MKQSGYSYKTNCESPLQNVVMFGVRVGRPQRVNRPPVASKSLQEPMEQGSPGPDLVMDRVVNTVVEV